MAIIIPHQLPLAPPAVSLPLIPYPPSRFQRTASQSTAVRFFVSISPLFSFQQSSLPSPSVCFLVPFVPFLRSFQSAPPFPLFCSFVPFVSLLRFFRSALSFPLFRSFVPFVSLLRFFRFALSFSSVRFLVSFGLLFRFLRSVSCFFWSVSTRHCVVARSFPSSSFLSFCQVFSSLSNPTHAFQCWRPCPSPFETTPFLPQEHALQRSRTRPSSCVSVYAWFRVSCKFCFTSCPPPCVGTFVCVLVKFFHTPKRLVGSFFSHRFSQMNRNLSANRGNPQTSASRRQISQSVIAIYHRTLHPSLVVTVCVIG